MQDLRPRAGEHPEAHEPPDLYTRGPVALTRLVRVLEPLSFALLFEVATRAAQVPGLPAGHFSTWGPVALIASALTLMSTGLFVVPRWVYNASEERNAALVSENKRLTRKIEWMAVNYPIFLRDIARTGKEAGRSPTGYITMPEEEEEWYPTRRSRTAPDGL